MAVQNISARQRYYPTFFLYRIVIHPNTGRVPHAMPVAMVMLTSSDPEWWGGLANFTNDRFMGEGYTSVVLMKQRDQKQQACEQFTHSSGILEKKSLPIFLNMNQWTWNGHVFNQKTMLLTDFVNMYHTNRNTLFSTLTPPSCFKCVNRWQFKTYLCTSIDDREAYVPDMRSNR